VSDHFVCPALTGSQWCAQPNDDELHNAPAKPCPCINAVDPNPTLDVHDNRNGTTTAQLVADQNKHKISKGQAGGNPAVA
jgi:hypothetical protein